MVVLEDDLLVELLWLCDLSLVPHMDLNQSTYVGFSIDIRENIRFLLNKTAGKVYYIFFTFAFSVPYNKSPIVLKKIVIDKYIIFVRKQKAVVTVFSLLKKINIV